MIQAAGGIVWRPAIGQANGVEVVVVHRPRYDDWSLPKGKLFPGEPPVVGAAREVEEETGCTPQVQRWLARTAYRVDGSRKVVDYWAIRCAGGEFIANDEVDAVRWLPADDVARFVARDKAVLRAFCSRPVDTTTVLLVRHARAGNKRRWKGDDALRPLDPVGQRQAAALAEVLPVFRPVRVISADRVRCVDTVRPVAARLGLDVEVDAMFKEAADTDPKEVAERLRTLALAGQPVVVCSQGGVIPETVSLLARKSDVKLTSPVAAKGSVWALSFDRSGHLVGADYYPPAPAPT
ncbi:MAG: NUDIX hydrolase [Actinomycetota bacterium]|nr:NUDIX hydrolase [Actinomycetota bacterium]